MPHSPTPDFDTVALADVTRTFGRRRALHRVSLTCRAGEIVALLGPNGAGKSTLLAVLSMLLAPSSGTVLYGGRPAGEARGALRRRIGLLAHDLYLYPELSPVENLRFFGRLYGVPAIDAAVDAALDRAHLHDRRDDAVAGFSRGMRQRLAIERALLHAPRLALLDEPFTGLDDAAQRAARARLSALRGDGAIVLLTTHDVEAVDGLADRAVMLHQGRLAEIEPGPGPLRERYRRALSAAT